MFVICCVDCLLDFYRKRAGASAGESRGGVTGDLFDQYAEADDDGEFFKTNEFKTWL